MQYTWQLALVLVPVYFIKHSVSCYTCIYYVEAMDYSTCSYIVCVSSYRPRLGDSLAKVIGAGVIYWVLAIINGVLKTRTVRILCMSCFGKRTNKQCSTTVIKYTEPKLYRRSCIGVYCTHVYVQHIHLPG